MVKWQAFLLLSLIISATLPLDTDHFWIIAEGLNQLPVITTSPADMDSTSFNAMGFSTLQINYWNTTVDYQNGNRTSIIFGGYESNKRINVSEVKIINIERKNLIYDIILGFTLS